MLSSFAKYYLQLYYMCAGVPHQDVPQLRPRAVQGVRAAPLDRVHGVHRRGGRQEEQDRVRTEHLRCVGGEHYHWT